MRLPDRMTETCPGGKQLGKRRHFHTQRTQKLLQQTLLVHVPSSAESSLYLETADQLNRLHLTESWYKLIPLHIGESTTVDLAIRLFLISNKIATLTFACIDDAPALYEKYWRAYGRVVGSLRQLMSTRDYALSDDALLTCALLAHCELGMGFQTASKDAPLKNTFTHLRGVQAILTSREQTSAPSELPFSLLAGQQTLLYEVPVALGLSSPFENIFPPLPSPSKVPSERIARLRLIGQWLLVDLPRLEMYLQRLNKARQVGYDGSSKSLSTMRLLAQRLLDCEDTESENVLLHRLQVRKSTEPDTVGPIPYYFHFTSLSDWEAGMYYWQSRLMLLRICWRLARFEPSLDRNEILEEGSRMTRNLLMSWPYGEEQRMFGLIRFVFASKVIWGALNDFKEVFDNVLELRKYLAKRNNLLLRGVFGQLPEERLDHIAKLYDGDGREDGPLVRLYQQNWPGKPLAKPGDCILPLCGNE